MIKKTGQMFGGFEVITLLDERLSNIKFTIGKVSLIEEGEDLIVSYDVNYIDEEPEFKEEFETEVGKYIVSALESKISPDYVIVDEEYMNGEV